MLLLKRKRLLQEQLHPDLINSLKKFVSNLSVQQTTSTTIRSSSSSSDEYLEKPIYPEILDNNIQARKVRQFQSWHDQIKNLNTIEEKAIKMNMPRYYGYKCVMLSDEKIPYNSLPLTKHYTRTVLESTENLPKFYDKSASVADSYIESIKSEIIDGIEFSADFFKQKYSKNSDLNAIEKDKIYGELIVQQINQSLLKHLSKHFEHLSNVEIDLEPRHEAFWWVGSIKPPSNLRKSRKGLKWLQDREHDPVDRVVQYLGKPYLALRHQLPLMEISTADELQEKEQESPKSNEIPLFPYDARTIGYSTIHRHGTNIPGFWPGSPYEFGLLSYQKREHMLRRNFEHDSDDYQKSLHAQGIQSSFAWLLAQATYQGFTTFNDITYPLCTQTIITNGQLWSFYVYELNTTVTHSNNPIDNPKFNKCWATPELKLYESIDDNNSKCIGFNDDVLKKLIQFYINQPAEKNIDLKPYLGKDEQKNSDIKFDDRRIFLENIYKHMSSNRPKHLLAPEIYMWEKIYKIDNKTRQLEAKKRFFERGVNPFKRRMDQHTPVYIPKAIRPGGPRDPRRWEKPYYP